VLDNCRRLENLELGAYLPTPRAHRQNGRIVLEDTGARLLQDPRLKTAYLGL
jgi:hypothetical protein